MSEDSIALLALKNAWTGAVAASDQVRDLEASVIGLDEGTPAADLDLAAWHKVTLAHSNAAMALRGLVEQLQRKQEKDEDSESRSRLEP